MLAPCPALWQGLPRAVLLLRVTFLAPQSCSLLRASLSVPLGKTVVPFEWRFRILPGGVPSMSSQSRTPEAGQEPQTHAYP